MEKLNWIGSTFHSITLKKNVRNYFSKNPKNKKKLSSDIDYLTRVTCHANFPADI